MPGPSGLNVLISNNGKINDWLRHIESFASAFKIRDIECRR